MVSLTAWTIHALRVCGEDSRQRVAFVVQSSIWCDPAPASMDSLWVILIADAGVRLPGRQYPDDWWIRDIDVSLPTGLVVPPNISVSSVSFYLLRTSGVSVTLSITVTGSYGTWPTFAGGGPDVW